MGIGTAKPKGIYADQLTTLSVFVDRLRFGHHFKVEIGEGYAGVEFFEV